MDANNANIEVNQGGEEVKSGEKIVDGYKGKKKVYIRVAFLKLGEIDTLKEFFVADVFIQARWREPSLDISNPTSVKAKTLLPSLKDKIENKADDYWDPQIIVKNMLTETKHSVWKTVKTNESGETYVVEKQRIKATFSENLELALFPFDIQDLTLMISTERSEAEIELVEDEEKLSSVHLETFAKKQEWSLRDCVFFQQKITIKEYANSKFKNPALLVGLYAGRKAGFFIWNVMLIMTIISSLSLATFAVDRDKPQNRLQLSFTLVLTGVAFKFVANQSIPKISYLTHLDRYILGSMIILYFVCMWHAVITAISNDDDSSKADRVAFIVFATIFAVFQVSFIVSVIISGYRRYSHVEKVKRIYQEKAMRKDGPASKNPHKWLKTSKIGSLFV